MATATDIEEMIDKCDEMFADRADYLANRPRLKVIREFLVNELMAVRQFDASRFCITCRRPLPPAQIMQQDRSKNIPFF